MSDSREDTITADAGRENRDDIDRVGEKTLTAEGKLNPFARIALFIRQIISELRKVVRPSRQELLSYTFTVIVFVLVVMAYVGVLDLGFTRLIMFVFGGSDTP